MNFLSLSDRIQGMFLGIAIGDALGMPVETKTPEYIKEKYGWLTEYMAPTRKGWEGKLKGTTTDDTQLTLAVSKALLIAGTSMDAQVVQHLKEKNSSTEGWGRTTTQALERLQNGTSFEISGTFTDAEYGTGNGVIMKLAPVLAYELVKGKDVSEFLIQLTKMTHNTKEALESTAAYYAALKYCAKAQEFDQAEFYKVIHQALGQDSCMLQYIDKAFSPSGFKEEDIKSIGGEGRPRFSCKYSLPLTIYCFLTAPTAIESLYEAVNAGGDTDTNASMVGALLGLFNGPDIFPKALVDGLDPKSKTDVLTHAQAWVT